MHLGITFLILHSMTLHSCEDDVNETIPAVEAIVGGRPAKIKDFPFLVSMNYFLSASKYGHWCCGFLLTPLWVGTAAHCLIHPNRTTKTIYSTKHFFLIAGSAHIKYVDSTYQIRIPERFVPHPSFSWSFLYNDIGLIKVKNPFHINKNLGLAILPKDSYHLEPWKNCVVAGWGAMNKNLQKTSDKLLFAELTILPHKLCLWSTGSSYFMNPKGSICTASGMEKKDACKGDSGSPLLCDLPHVEGDVLAPDLIDGWKAKAYSMKNKAHRKVVGIVSWSWACYRPGIPGFYTDIKEYRSWMKEIVHSSSSSADYMKEITVAVIAIHSFLQFDFP